jgi:hypothetical protein
MERAFDALKSGGHIVFLMTPNTHSLCYLLFKTVPLVGDHKGMFLIPNATSLSIYLKNIGFEIVKVEFPYLGTPYAHPVRDHLKFVKRLLFRTHEQFAFWRNSMNILARKP